MTEKTNKNDLIKIVYFDEQAALDALSIINGGTTLKTISNSLGKENQEEIEGHFGKNFWSFLGFGLKGNAKREKNTLIQNQVTSTLISEFIAGINSKKLNFLEIENPSLRIQNESNAYYRNLLPITKMIKNFEAIDIDQETKNTLTSINFDQFGGALDSLSAYYELEGTLDEKPAVFRFNIDGLRNNYTLFDLVKISRIKVYGLRTGDLTSLDLTFNKEIEDLVPETDTTEEFIERRKNFEKGTEKRKSSQRYPLIDVVLAGVEA